MQPEVIQLGIVRISSGKSLVGSDLRALLILGGLQATRN
jgi:hypothetical protein